MRSPRLTLIPLLAGAALLAAACGSGSSSSAAKAPSSTAAPPASAGGSLTTVKIGKATNTEDMLAINLAQQQGFFRDAGINVKIALLGGSSVANAALQSGSIQFSVASATSVLLAASRGVPLQAVGAIDQSDPAQLVVANSWVKKKNLSPSEPLAQRIQGLQGATFAALSTSDKSVLAEFEKVANVPSSSIDAVSISSEAAMLTAMQHNEAQAFIASPPTSNLAVGNGYGTVIANASELKYANDEEYNVLITTPAYAKAHPKIITGMTTAIGRALALMASQDPKAITLIHSTFPTLSTSVIKASLSSLKLVPSMQQTSQGWQDALTFGKETGFIKSTGSINASSGGIWTNSYLANKG